MNSRETRRSAGLSQARLGKFAGPGHHHISRSGRRQHGVTVDIRHRDVRGLSVPVADLIEEDGVRRA